MKNLTFFLGAKQENRNSRRMFSIKEEKNSQFKEEEAGHCSLFLTTYWLKVWKQEQKRFLEKLKWVSRNRNKSGNIFSALPRELRKQNLLMEGKRV